MRFKLSIARPLVGAAALLVGAGGAWGSECSEQIRLLDDRYSLSIAGAPETPRPPPASQPTSSGAGGSPTTSAGLDTVPNTGGIANPHNTPVETLDQAQRERVRASLAEARRADEAGDGTTCAAKVAEARRIAQGGPAEPAAK